VKHRVYLVVVVALGLAAALWLLWPGEPAVEPAVARRAGGASPTDRPHPVSPMPARAKPSAAAAPTGLPISLPDTPAVAAWLKEQGTPDVREMQDYLLGLNHHVHDCMGGAVVRGEIRFWIHWIVDDDHVGRAAYEPDTSAASVGLDDAARELFETCVTAYLAAHDATLPSHGGDGHSDVHWATAISFPIAEQEIYRVITEGDRRELPTGDD
jgi:hypothetical protein